MIKSATKSHNLKLSDESKNAKNGAQLINIQNDECYISCMIDQKPEIELHDQYWPHLHAVKCS
jgi:hypothetical protein